MDVIPEISQLASRYQCDPRDPTFAVIELVFGIRDEIREELQARDAVAQKDEWIALEQRIQARSQEFQAVVKNIAMENNRAEALAKRNAQLLLATRQHRIREKVACWALGVICTLLPVLTFYHFPLV